MSTVSSTDGTAIAWDSAGRGPALILVDGALCHRDAGPSRALADRLVDRFTVYRYDRRGRGASGDTPPYHPDREVEDLRAVVGAAGGSAAVYAISSGAAPAIRAAATVPGITRLALYEPPYTAETAADDDTIRGYTERLTALLAADRRGDAVALFMTTVGVPDTVVAGMRTGPAWPALTAIAPTLAHDDRLLTGGRVPSDIAAAVDVPALVLAGTEGPPVMRRAAERVADALPHGRVEILDGQSHDVDPAVLAPRLTAFLTAD